MNRYIFAFFIAIIIHLFLLFVFILSIKLIPKNENQVIKKEKRIKISLKEILEKEKEPPKKQKKIIKKTPLPIKKTTKTIIKKTKLPINKTIKKKKIYTKPIKTIIKKTKPILKQKPITKDPMAWLYEDKSSEVSPEQIIKDKTVISAIAQDINKLYGSKFTTLSKNQQQYILDNQEIMRRITQKILNRVASVNLKGDININTSNIIEFYLHPNGNMSDFKFLEKTGYFVLDDTTKETIEYAYSQYPRPKEKTLIRYNVFYNLKY